MPLAELASVDLIPPVLAAALGWSVSFAGDGDREAYAFARQVAPDGCVERLRSANPLAAAASGTNELIHDYLDAAGHDDNGALFRPIRNNRTGRVDKGARSRHGNTDWCDDIQRISA
jgi:hypothetical protein